MSFDAKVYKILIASPGDVAEERIAIADVIAKWNDQNAESSGVVILPVRWETHSAPLMGDRPQSVINNQLLQTCDMAIGVFYTRLGSPTGMSESGTAEEIEWFIKNNRPVMLYFSTKNIDPTILDIDQYKSLKDFEKKMKKIGLVGSYSSSTDLKEQLLNQISINVRLLITGQPLTAPTVKATKQKIETIMAIAKSGKVYMEDYEKDGIIRSFVVKGDTKPLKEDLKKLGGKYNQSIGGWFFPKSREVEIAEYLKSVSS